MPLDYSHRKQVNRNRPKKRSPKLYLLLILGAVSGVYALGIGTGWLLFKNSKQDLPQATSNSAKADEKQKGPEPSPAAKDAGSTPSPTGKANEAPLTFYYTLPKGDKGVIGSGVNLPRDESPVMTKRDAPVADSHVNVTKPQPPSKTEQREAGTKSTNTEKEKTVKETTPNQAKEKPKESLPIKQKKEGGKSGYSVQVGSYHDKNEAQSLKNSLEKNGFSARIVEFAVPGKGILYRVRVGNKMDQEAANRLAGKVGKSAIAVPE